MNHALYYETLAEKAVKCLLCPYTCIISEGNYGSCRVRKNVDGTLYSKNYGKVAAYNIDPIEKKPLYHFYPGKNILSIGGNGCNLKCSFCQNWQISQQHVHTYEATPQDIVEQAQKINDNIGVAYTYSESIVWYEFMYETAQLVKEHNMCNVLISNGYINQEPLKQLLPYIDALNIDLKAFSNTFYQEMCSATLQPVLETIETAVKHSHVELTTLLIPGKNDDLAEITEMCKWIASISKDIPIHFSKYHPTYKCNEPSTSMDILNDAYEIACQHLNFVFVGNVYAPEKSCSYCPECKTVLVERSGGFSAKSRVNNGKCPNCGYNVLIIGDS